MLAGYIPIASTARCFSTVGIEALDLINVTHEAFGCLMNRHVEAQPGNGCGVWCSAGGSNFAIGGGEFSECGSYLAAILRVKPGRACRVQNIGTLVRSESCERSLQFPGK